MTDHETGMAWVKVALAWLGVVIGGVTLSQVALVFTIAFTAFQLYTGVRKLRREIRMEKLEALLKHQDTES
jgi:EamA domain-containing membrane protein RarD